MFLSVMQLSVMQLLQIQLQVGCLIRSTLVLHAFCEACNPEFFPLCPLRDVLVKRLTEFSSFRLDRWC